MGEHQRRRPVTETQTNGEDTEGFAGNRSRPILYKTTRDDNVFSTSRADLLFACGKENVRL